MKRRALLLALALLPACASAPKGPPVHEYTFVFLRQGPGLAQTPKEQLPKLQEGHMANINRLADERALLLAGPFGAPSPEPELRGIFVFAERDTRAVDALLASDPMISAQVLAGESAPWSTTTDLAAALARWEAFEEQGKSDPEFSFMKGMRTYYAVFAEEGERASRALEPLRASGKLAMEGRFGGTRAGQALFLVDAAKPAEGAALLAPLGDLGPTRCTPWFGSAFLR
jgi:uncharacterized protein YciI